MRRGLSALVLSAAFISASGATSKDAAPVARQPEYLPDIRFHLTARPWAPINAPKSKLLDQVDAIIHQLAPLQYWNASDANDAKNGAIIDPYGGVEVQYATPYFSFAVATALTQGRAADLIAQGIRALDHATADINGLDGTPLANDNTASSSSRQ